jgi:hypothetical protein
MALLQVESSAPDVALLAHWFASGAILPSQLPSPSGWGPEKKLAAAVLGGALIEIRDHCHDANHRRKVADDLQWVHSDDTAWPYSFVRLCELFALEPAYVRRVVRGWKDAPARTAHRQISVHRHAA